VPSTLNKNSAVAKPCRMDSGIGPRAWPGRERSRAQWPLQLTRVLFPEDGYASTNQCRNHTV